MATPLDEHDLKRWIVQLGFYRDGSAVAEARRALGALGEHGVGPILAAVVQIQQRSPRSS